MGVSGGQHRSEVGHFDADSFPVSRRMEELGGGGEPTRPIGLEIADGSASQGTGPASDLLPRSSPS